MKVREVMTSDVSFCSRTATLTDAAIIMWQRDCGAVPVVDEQNRIAGIITDRDICIAVATKNRLPSQISVSEITNQKVETCAPQDEAEEALKKMKKHQLRRLPVVSRENVLLGILSISDLLRHAGRGSNAVSRKKIFAALKEITSFRPLQLREISVEAIAPTNEIEAFDDPPFAESREVETENSEKEI